VINNQKSWIRLFADDALLYSIVSIDIDGDQLQEDLKKLEVWQNKWQMSFNPAKWKAFCLSTKKVPQQRKYVFCGVEQEQVGFFCLSRSNPEQQLEVVESRLTHFW